jgi:hypothetical protein
MWGVVGDNEQVPNVQKSFPDQMVRIAQSSHLALLAMFASSETTRLF